MEISTIGIDIAKNVFQLEGVNHKGKSVSRKRVRRESLFAELRKMSISCEVAMEACGGSHYLGRELSKLGYKVKILPTQHVKPFCMTQKNDRNDALAITEAARRPKIMAVAIKSERQQVLQLFHRQRQMLVEQRTRIVNMSRGILYEFGEVIPLGITSARLKIKEIIEQEGQRLIPEIIELIKQNYSKLKELDIEIKELNKKFIKIAKEDEQIRIFTTVPGVGTVAATALYAAYGKFEQFGSGRDFAAALGLVPKQYSSGDKQVLGGISKTGNKYIRTLLVQGAMSVIRHSKNKTDSTSLWINKLREAKGHTKAAVALANKMARTLFAVGRSGRPYDPQYVSVKPQEIPKE